MKILIFGGNGQVAQEFKSIPLLTGEHVHVFSKEQVNICDPQSVKKALTSVKPDFVINCAAYTNVDGAESEQEKAFMINSHSLLAMSELCNEIDAVLIHLSTDYVFSGLKYGPYVETDTPTPINTYGKSKLQGELNIVKHCKKYIILRTSWIFGEHGNNFVKTMHSLILQKTLLKVVNDQVGGPTSSGSVAAACLSICRQAAQTPSFTKWGIYHFSGAPYVSWFEFAQKIRQSLSHKMPNKSLATLEAVTSQEYKTASTRPKNSTLDCTLLLNEFHIPQSEWEAELLDCIDKSLI